MDIGSKIRAVRKKKQMTIAQMCEATGLSKGFISNIENNHTSPSISTLQTIAGVLDVPLAYFFLEKKQHMRVIRKEERNQTILKEENLLVEHINFTRGLRMVQVELPPGGSNGEGHAHEGEEIHLILKGTVLAEQGEDSFTLQAGDSFSWNASVPHFVKNIGDTPAIILMTVTTDTHKQAEDIF
ncbi:cupin domain-containing protein [Bacillus sp. FJAT-42315]|uniref:cupin domain-containing protein n=1 Tax=Bacillus sp. FJAT-42315 TaxID=2014077 RepID=UPI000C24DDAA|nr:cupin domain-containing protein [Bacillus sp. FJAT-42315]